MRLLPDRVCSSCNDRKKREWGCTKDTPIPIRFDGVESRRCPARVLHPDEGNISGLSDLLWYYGRYKGGSLPEPGGVNDQPAKLVAQFRLIDAVMAEVDAEEREEQGGK